MTAFPTLTPSSRTYTPGEYPHSPFAGMSGKQNRTRHSNVMLSSQLRLGFIGLTESEMLSILSHYQGELGTFISFTLPSVVWSGANDVADYELNNYRWRYIEPPTVEDLMCGGHNVELLLESLPPEGTALTGLAIQIVSQLSVGNAAAANGLSQTATILLDAGFPVAPGLAEIVTTAIDAGSATGNCVVAGIDNAIPFDVLAGSAAAANGLELSVAVALTGGSAVGTTGIPVGSITYSQSSTYSGTAAASNSIMTDGSFNNTGAATNLNNPAWVKMDLGAIYDVAKVVIGTGTSNIPGGWTKLYTENRLVQYSTDDSSWTTAFNTGTFASNGIYTFNSTFAARYIRIATSGSQYVAISEFYALAAGQAYP